VFRQSPANLAKTPNLPCQAAAGGCELHSIAALQPPATGSDVAGFRWRPATASHFRLAASGELSDLLVLLRLLAVFGVGRLLRHAGYGVRVLLAGLRGLLVGLVRLVLRGFAHGDLSLGVAAVLPRRSGSHASA